MAGEIAAGGAPEDVLTPEILRAVYGVDMLIVPHPHTGRPQVRHTLTSLERTP